MAIFEVYSSKYHMINRKNSNFGHLEFKKYITNCNNCFFERLSSDSKLADNKKSW